MKANSNKGGEIRDTKTLNLSRNIILFRCKFSSMFPVFHLSCVINLSRNKNICCGLKKVVAKSRARVYFEQQILALRSFFIKLIKLTTRATNLLVTWKINQSARRISSTRNKCFVAGQVDGAR